MATTIKDFLQIYKNSNVTLTVTDEDDEQIGKFFADGETENFSDELLAREIKRVKQVNAIQATVIVKNTEDDSQTDPTDPTSDPTSDPDPSDP